MLIELQNLTRLYGIVIGINDISLSLPSGAHGLLGPNGAGKTTLLNLLTGQLSPTIGSVRVLGETVKSNPQLLRKLGYLPGFEGMYADVSALEWVTYLTRIQGYSRREATRLATQAMERVKLTDHMNRKISTYSRGMRQRTRLAQAIAHEPEFLILDEPFSGLDPIARHTMTTLLQEWIAGGHSLLISSHVLHEIESLTRSFMLLSSGRLLASGSADDIQNLLTNVPSEMRIRVNLPREFAVDMLQNGLVDSLRITDQQELLVTTPVPRELALYVATVAAQKKFVVSEIRAAEDSLQDVFNSLMKIHRGRT